MVWRGPVPCKWNRSSQDRKLSKARHTRKTKQSKAKLIFECWRCFKKSAFRPSAYRSDTPFFGMSAAKRSFEWKFAVQVSKKTGKKKQRKTCKSRGWRGFSRCPFWSLFGAAARPLCAYFLLFFRRPVCPCIWEKGLKNVPKKVSKKRRKKSRKKQGKTRFPAGSRGFLGFSFLSFFSKLVFVFFIDFSFSWNCVPHTTAGEKLLKNVQKSKEKNDEKCEK